MQEYMVVMSIAGDVVPSSAVCSGTLDKCLRALNHLEGIVDSDPDVGWLIVPCLD